MPDGVDRPSRLGAIADAVGTPFALSRASPSEQCRCSQREQAHAPRLGDERRGAWHGRALAVAVVGGQDVEVQRVDLAVVVEIAAGAGLAGLVEVDGRSGCTSPGWSCWLCRPSSPGW